MLATNKFSQAPVAINTIPCGSGGPEGKARQESHHAGAISERPNATMENLMAMPDF